MAFEDFCNTALTLGSRSIHKPGNYLQSHNHQLNMQLMVMKFDHVISSLTLGLSSEEKNRVVPIKIDGESTILDRDASHLISVVSSHSNSTVKRQRCKDVSEEEVEKKRIYFKERVDQVDEEGMSARKKLRLSKEQSFILETRFREQSTLNPKQKQALAKQLNLRTRQVEVWFQNRRARTKSKQTEVECEVVKKDWETLTVENKRLQKELQELKAINTSPFSIQLPTDTQTVCPSCERYLHFLTRS